MSKNTDACGRSTLDISTSRLSMDVVGGALRVRFTSHRSNGNRLPVARSRRVGMRR